MFWSVQSEHGLELVRRERGFQHDLAVGRQYFEWLDFDIGDSLIAGYQQE